MLTIHRALYALRRNARDNGLGRTLTKTAGYLVRPLYEDTTYRIYGIDIHAHASSPEPVEGFSFRLLSPGDGEEIQQVEAIEEWLEGELADRLRDGSLCLVATKDGQVAAFNLVSTGTVNIPVVHLRWTFRPDEAWSEQISTHHNWRKRGLGTALRGRIVAELHARGFRWLLGGTRVRNAAALALARRAGFTELGDLCYHHRLHLRSWEYKELAHGTAGPDTRPFDGIDHVPADQLAIQPKARRA